MCAKPRRRRSTCTSRLALNVGARIRTTRWCAARSSRGSITASDCASVKIRFPIDDPGAVCRGRPETPWKTRHPSNGPGIRVMALTLYPAIDLKDGSCVRLRRGEMDQATIYADDPAAQAAAWRDAGFKWLHVVDLNGAFSGRPVNAEAVRGILGAVDLPVQLGGGIRDMAGIEAWLDAGVRRVILGSAAAKNPDLVIEACQQFPGRIVVGIDARG